MRGVDYEDRQPAFKATAEIHSRRNLHLSIAFDTSLHPSSSSLSLCPPPMSAPASSPEYEFEWAPSPAAASSTSGRGSPPAKIIDSLSPPLIAMFAVVGAAFIIIVYARLLSRNIRRLFRLYRRRRRLRSAASELGSQSRSQSPPHAFAFAGDSYSDYLLSPYGLDDAAIKTLPLSHFSKTKGKQTNRECAVCLFEFDDGDWLRTLPLCSHAFHVECIDIWLRSHATCPLCRAAVSFLSDSPFIPMRAARIRPSFDDLLLEPPPLPLPLSQDLETAASPPPAMIPEQRRRDFFLKRSYSFGYERSAAAERMVMEAATTSPPWRHRQHQSQHHRGFWSKRWPSPFGGGGSSSASRSVRGVSLRGMKSPFMRRWGFVQLAGGGVAATATESAARRSRSVASPSALWMGRAFGGFSSSRMRCGDPEALLSPERFNRR